MVKAHGKSIPANLTSLTLICILVNIKMANYMVRDRKIIKIGDIFIKVNVRTLNMMEQEFSKWIIIFIRGLLTLENL
jgi:hypothetical protein